MIKKLRLKFVIINMSTVSVLLFLIFGMVLHFTQQNLREDSMKMMQLAAAERPMPGMPDSLRDDVRLPFFVIEEMPHGEDAVFGGSYFELEDETVSQLKRISEESGEPVGTIEEYKLRYMHINSPYSKRTVFVDISTELNTMKTLARNCVLIGLASFFAFLFVSIMLARWAVKPVDEAWEQQRQFVADASHELKTPLTVILSNAELMQDESYDEKSRQGFADSILVMSKQMKGLVESLLELARADSGTNRSAFVETDLSDELLQAALPFEALFYERGLELESSIEEGLHVKGSADMLRRCAEILLDNACKYSQKGGKVELSLKKEGRNALLSLSSPGAEISKEDLKNIFKRFYRIDKARSRDGSYGLGLSLAESMVRDHGGRIWAESAAGINSFYIQLPLI